MTYKAKPSPSRRPAKKVILLACIGVAVILVVAVLELTNVTHIFHDKKAVSGSIPTKTISKSQPPTNAADNDQETTSNGASTPATPKPAPTGGTGATDTSGATLLAPSGSFVSNHKPGQNGSPLDEQSTCITTPGATCTIIFKNGSVQRTLEPHTADSSGVVTWDWKISESGLTKGTWSITASVSLNGQTKTTDDATPLEIQ